MRTRLNKMTDEYYFEGEIKMSYDGDQYSGWENDDPDDYYEEDLDDDDPDDYYEEDLDDDDPDDYYEEE